MKQLHEVIEEVEKLLKKEGFINVVIDFKTMKVVDCLKVEKIAVIAERK